MKHKYKVYEYVGDKLIFHWEEEEMNPILYLNDMFNFLDKERFDEAYSHGKGSAKETYDIVRKHLEVLNIIKEKRVDIDLFITILKDENQTDKLWSYNFWNKERQLTQQEFDLIKEVLL